MGVVIYEVMSGAPFGMDVITTGAPAEYEAFALKVRDCRSHKRGHPQGLRAIMRGSPWPPPANVFSTIEAHPKLYDAIVKGLPPAPHPRATHTCTHNTHAGTHTRTHVHTHAHTACSALDTPSMCRNKLCLQGEALRRMCGCEGGRWFPTPQPTVLA